jgi:hypothetical protein
LRRRRSRKYKDAGADDGADAETREVEGAEGAFERVLPFAAGFLLKYGEGLRRPHTHGLLRSTDEERTHRM